MSLTPEQGRRVLSMMIARSLHDAEMKVPFLSHILKTQVLDPENTKELINQLMTNQVVGTLAAMVFDKDLVSREAVLESVSKQFGSDGLARVEKYLKFCETEIVEHQKFDEYTFDITKMKGGDK